MLLERLVHEKANLALSNSLLGVSQAIAINYISQHTIGWKHLDLIASIRSPRVLWLRVPLLSLDTVILFGWPHVHVATALPSRLVLHSLIRNRGRTVGPRTCLDLLRLADFHFEILMSYRLFLITNNVLLRLAGLAPTRSIRLLPLALSLRLLPALAPSPGSPALHIAKQSLATPIAPTSLLLLIISPLIHVICAQK